MGWFLGIGAFLLFIWGMVKFPKFRWGMLATIAIISISIWLYTEREKELTSQSRLKIKRDELALSDVRLHNDYGNSFTIAGKIKNLSHNHTLKKFGIRVELFDCLKKEKAKKQNCEIIGQDAETVYVSIPPNQVRQFDEYLHFSDLPAVDGKFVWDFDVIWIEAAK